MSNLTKTIKLRIHVTPEQETLFRQMTEQYRQACNFVSQYIFDHRFNMTYQSLNRELYSDLRSQFGLKSQLAQSSIKTTIARYKTVKQQLFQNPYRYKDEDGNWQRITKTWNGFGSRYSLLVHKLRSVTEITVSWMMVKSYLSIHSAKEPNALLRANISLNTLMALMTLEQQNWSNSKVYGISIFP
ncbi:IS607 family transposase (Fragment) [Megasphaera elsdenii DSM 20460]|uniref:IS607 family transposase n=1 Tax=Megasphaera elsdenii DSM 20460 TaxID=1064535 RepID=G0VPZ5_MEGEL